MTTKYTPEPSFKTADEYKQDEKIADSFSVDVHLVVRDGAGNKIIEGGSTLLQDNTLYNIIEDIANYLNDTNPDEGEGTGI
jgi:hypothetical protein